MKHKSLKLGILVLVLVLGVLVLRDQKETRNTANVADNKTVVRVADLPVIHALPYYYALEKGYFEEVGIEIERVHLDAPNLIIDALLTGEVDMTGPSGALGIAGIASQKSGGALKIYAASGGDLEIIDDSIVVRQDSTLKDVSDLKGKSLGILPGIQWRTISRHILAQYNLEPETDVTIVELAPALQAQALGSGQIDALLAIEPMLTVAKVKHGARELLPAATAQTIANPFFPGAGIIRTEFAKSNPELVETILDVLERSLSEINENPAETKLYARGYTPFDEVLEDAPVLRIQLARNFTDNEVRAIQKFYDIFYRYGVVEKPIDAREMIYVSP